MKKISKFIVIIFIVALSFFTLQYTNKNNETEICKETQSSNVKICTKLDETKVVMNQTDQAQGDEELFLEDLQKSIAECKKLNNAIVYVNGKTIFHSEDVDENSQFFVASTTKQFTACLILMILNEKNNADIEKTKHDLHLPLCDLLKGTKLLQNIANQKSNLWLTKVSLHMLLTHTSGIDIAMSSPIFFKIIATKSINTITPYDLITSATSFDSDKVGEYLYSDANYVILARIIEELSGASFSTCLQKHITSPLNLSKTLNCDKGTFKENKIANSNIVLNPKEKSPLDLGLITGAGSMISSAKDLNIWTQNLHSDAPLMGKELHKLMFTPYVDVPMKNHTDTQYGYGIAFTKICASKNDCEKTSTEIFHKGDFRAFGKARTFLGHYTTPKITVILLTNNVKSIKSLTKAKSKAYNKLLQGNINE